MEFWAAIGAIAAILARRVSAWIGGFPQIPFTVIDQIGPPTFATLYNASDEPVYRVIAWLVFVQGDGPRRSEEASTLNPDSASTIGALPPGAFVIDFPSDWGGMYRRPGVEVAFTDAAGVHWVRRSDGDLDELPEDPVDYYKVPRPVDWREPIAAGRAAPGS